MSGPPEVLVLLHVQGQVVEVLSQGSTLPLSPLEGELLRLLAEAGPGPVSREHLVERLELPLTALYRLVYRLRQRLGARSILQVGRASSRGRGLGFSGYRLARPSRLEGLLTAR